MRTTSKLLALALTAGMQSAMAGVVFLDFEDVHAIEPLTNRYAAQHVTVTGAAWTAPSRACGSGVSFSRPNSCGALLLAEDPAQDPSVDPRSFTMSLSDGFEALSFVYSGNTSAIDLAVHVFDASGKELGLGLSGLTGSECGNGFNFCNWSDPITLSFTGVARTVTFSGADQTILIDDVKFTTPSTGPGRLPEPTSVALALGALGGLGWTRRRSAR
jgi:hypothetical protein